MATDLPALNLNKVFEKVENEEQWFPQIPEEYLSQLKYAPQGALQPVRRQVPGAAPLGGALQGLPRNQMGIGGPLQEDRPQSIVSNIAYNVTFERFKSLNIPVSTIWRCLSDNPGMTRSPPCPSNASVEMCLTFHIKGLYNTCCGRAGEHIAHRAAQDASLLTWCGECYMVA